MLKINDLESGYGSMQVLWQPSMEVREGKITALLGPNGVGKTTTLNTILGSVRAWRGTIIYQGDDITYLPTHRKVDRGIALVPEGKHLFVKMSTYENLVMGAYPQKASAKKDDSLELVYSLFPILKERSRQRAGSLSGGEQQMLTIARALMSRPKLIMLDEPSQGLAPKLVGEVFAAVRKMKTDLKLTILLVEQDIEASLEMADYVYIMHEGQIKAKGLAETMKGSPEIRQAFLGM